MTNHAPGLEKVGEYYHFALTLNGQRIHGSTKAKDLPTARLVLEQKRKEILQGQTGHGVVPTLAQITSLWLRDHKTVFSRKHWSDVESVSRVWLLPVLGSKKIDRIQTQDVSRLRSRMLGEGRSPVTTNDALKILKLLCRYALKLGHIREIPFRVEFLKVQRKPRATIPGFRLGEFLATVDQEARNPHVRLILRVMIGLGLRESEALGMRWEWLDPENRTYTVGRAKGKEARVLPVPDWLWQAIQGMATHHHPETLSPWCFPAEDGRPHRSQLCTKVLRRVCIQLGLGNVTQHRLRATFATLHASAGTPLPEIQGMLGHKKIETTMIYIETSLEAKRKAQDALALKMGLA